MGDLFEDQAKDWDGRDTIALLSKAVGAAVIARTPLAADWHIMDFGAGTGLISSQVAPLVDKITAVDISQSMLEKLSRKPELQGKVEIVCQDILDEPLDQTFDLIMSAMACHHVQDTHRLLQTFADHLKPGGRIALADLDREDGSFHPVGIEGVYHKGFDRQDLGAMLEQHGFEQVEFTTAHSVEKNDRSYPVFLVTAVRLRG
jgi:2-polyprenyl-3-methyl-5-hydroxy-6-metoxy-1,4-benzoquinol methylase